MPAAYDPFLHPGRKGFVQVPGEQALGFVGELHPVTARRYGFDDPVVGVELDLDRLRERLGEPPRAQPLSEFPPLRQDISVVVPDEHPASSVLAAARDAGGELLSEVHVFDVWHDAEALGPARRSLALRLTFQAQDHTLSDEEVRPVINGYWERAEFPFELIPKLAALNIAGGSLRGYGCPGMSQTAAGLVALELARGDASICTFFGVHSGLAMSSIAMLGSEEQRQQWLPAMAKMEKIGAFALTEPKHGSDAVMLETRARREGAEYVLDGEKRWIGNASFADVVIVWARDDEGNVGGFLVEKGTPGFDAQVMTGKVAKWWMPDDVAFVSEIPHTATGKILKSTLRTQFKDYRLPSG
jgi:hypothetical protein